MRNKIVASIVASAAVIAVGVTAFTTTSNAEPMPAQQNQGSALVEIVTPPTPSQKTKTDERKVEAPEEIPNALPTLPGNSAPPPDPTSNTVSNSLTPRPLPPGCPPGPVFVVGDSLTDPTEGGSGAYLPNMFARLGIPVTVYGRKSMSIADILTGSRGITIGSPAAQNAQTWVIAMGTNDSQSSFATKIDQVMSAAANRQVYWINVQRPDNSIPGPATGINTALVNATKKYTRLHIIDYVTAITSHPEHLSADGIHLKNGEAYQWRAKLYLTPWNACR